MILPRSDASAFCAIFGFLDDFIFIFNFNFKFNFNF